ncbi:uncharacterized protein LOC128547224 [Mercenaria mercenaria]|uniref:uncharacterized protein LOC128547224 n=1 Tax=Mercenaria mercenaria TaxID=6596 RepID=UPI00234EEC3C|nr:uncharacterized protein LOC128547224 [Mercenaria mercenaria]
MQEYCNNEIDIIEDGEDFRVSTVSNLDLYLDKLYEKKIKFTVEDDVVDFIQNGVETLVQDLMNFVMKQNEIQKEIAALKERYRSATFIDNPELLRVGSFYEGTKNTFPDEFDFIYVVLCSPTPVLKEKTGGAISIFDRFVLFAIMRMIEHDINDISDYAIKMYESSHYSLNIVGKAEQCQNGPNVKLKLRFKRKCIIRKPVDIFVDITPGIKVLARNMTKFITTICPLKPFSKEVCIHGSFLLVSSHNMETKMTFTETEVKIMNHNLSYRHRKVYRLLKYLINANVDEVELRKLRFSRHVNELKFWLSSYDLKRLMIYHHLFCKRDERVPDTCCLFDILELILSRVSAADIDKCNGYEIGSVYAGIPPLIYTDVFNIDYCSQILLFKDKRKYLDVMKTLLNGLITDLKLETSLEDSDDRFESVASFSERLYGYLQLLTTRKKKRRKLKVCTPIMLLVLIIMLYIFFVLYLSLRMDNFF